MSDKKELIEVVEEQGIEKSQAQTIVDDFKGFFDGVKKYEQKAKEIVVKDETETDKMLEARETRLELKKIRVDAEKVRKEKKEFFLRGGKAVDGIANIIKATIVPLEEHLEKQEKFVEIQEEERKAKLNIERIKQLSQYVEDVDVYDLKEMSEDAFGKLLKTHKDAFEAQKKAEEEAEKERIAQEKAEKEEQERIRKENEALKKEAEEREKKEVEERAKREAEEKARQEKEQKEREEREKLEKELEEKRIAEQKAKEEEEAKKKEAELIAKRKKYQEWLKENGYDEENKTDFHIENKTDVVVLYKRVSVFTK